MTIGELAVHLFVGIGVLALAMAGVDIWHRAVAGTSFWGQYLRLQVLPSLLSEGQPQFHGDYLFYLREMVRTFWPTLPFAIAGIGLAIRRKSAESVPAICLALIALCGVVGGFSLASLKTPWYGNINSAALAILFAIAIRLSFSKNRIEESLPRLCTLLTAGILFASALFPSLFRYHRPAEEFFENASHTLGKHLDERSLADCAGLEPWRGPALVQFYLGARRTSCDWNAPLVWRRQKGSTSAQRIA